MVEGGCQEIFSPKERKAIHNLFDKNLKNAIDNHVTM